MNASPEPSPTSPSNSSAAAAPVTVLFDGACPLCQREIAVYRGLQPTTPLCFADISNPAQPLPSPLPAGTTRQQLMARFHVLDSSGQLLSGARAFLALWATLPGWRWLAYAGRVPGAAALMEVAYRVFLRLRPTLQRWAARLDKSR
jgi:3-demethoxyubiquinol 3-hydroxylase